MKIVIFQPMLKVYRLALFEKLNHILSASNHELRVVVGTPWKEELLRHDNACIETDYYFFEDSYWLFKNKVHILKDVLKHIYWADIVITEQANKHMHNYFLLTLSHLQIKPFAYWGHGANRLINPNSIREKFKRRLAIKCDWWFAYTKSVADYLISLGFDQRQITVLNNSIDTLDFKLALDNLTGEEISAFRQEYKIPDRAKIALFCGSLHKDKCMRFLLDSAVYIHQQLPDFVLLVGGGGEDRPLVESYAEQYNFIIYLHRLDGMKKSLAFKSAQIFLNPGMVGLAILDAFTAGLPLMTTNQKMHSPEIDYLNSGYNGIMSSFNMEDFAQAVISVLNSESTLNYFQHNARNSSHQYSIENMVENFFIGLEKFIAAKT
ncbi:MAG: glycosyltransferase family 4 protein [Methylomonas sp.]|jgi:glycosyltransferase involved in cell wall biosynthesis